MEQSNFLDINQLGKLHIAWIVCCETGLFQFIYVPQAAGDLGRETEHFIISHRCVLLQGHYLENMLHMVLWYLENKTTPWRKKNA